MYNAVTRHISVTVTPYFIEEQSDPDDNHFVWAYQVNIENTGRETVQLVSRYWHITDAHGQVQEVRGDGVVGEQPHLKPGQGFRYSSGAVLETPVGSMHGSYQMLADDGAHFDAPIPAFRLAKPGMLH